MGAGSASMVSISCPIGQAHPPRPFFALHYQTAIAMWKCLVLVLLTAGAAQAQTIKMGSGSARQRHTSSSQVPATHIYEPMQVDQVPHFPDGQAALRQWFEQHIDYPREALADSARGTVLVRFIIDKTGYVRRAEVAQSANPLFNDEALRLVRAMPTWNPGTRGEETVAVQMDLPISFEPMQYWRRHQQQANTRSGPHK